MNTWAFVGLVGLAGSIGACSSDNGNNDAGTDVGTDTGPTGGNTYDYVLSALSIDQSSDPADLTSGNSIGHTGFNVDGRCSGADMTALADADCSHVDFYSQMDPDQNGSAITGGMQCAMPTQPNTTCRACVDNQLPAILNAVAGAPIPNLPTDLRATVASYLQAGSTALLFRVSGVDGTLGPSLNDPSVTVRVYIGHSTDTGTTCTSIFNGMGNFAIDASSLTSASDLSSAKVMFTGSIVNGRLQIHGTGSDSSFLLPIPPISGTTLNLSLVGVQLRVDLRDGPSANGNLGGYISRNDLVTQVTPLVPTEYRSFLSLLDNFVDVATGTPASCGGTGSTAGGISLGLGFNLVKAHIASASVTAQPMGACGWTAPDGGVADAH